MKKIFITGISSGIGKAIIHKLSKNYECYGTTKNLAKLSKSLPANIININNVIELDFTKIEGDKNITSVLNKIPDDIDVLINNAGIALFSPFIESKFQDLTEQVKVNFYSNFLITKYFLPLMVQRKQGTIINILSVASLKPFEFASIYSATKSASVGLFSSIREEVRSQNIKITNVFLGATNTKIWDSQSRKEFGERMIKPTQVADAIYSLILLSQHSEMMVEDIVIRPQGGDL